MLSHINVDQMIAPAWWPQLRTALRRQQYPSSLLQHHSRCQLPRCPTTAPQVSELKGRCSALPSLREEQRQLSADASEAERLAALNSELRLRSMELGSLQQEAQRMGPMAEEAQALKQQLQEMREDAEELPAVKVCMLIGSVRLTLPCQQGLGCCWCYMCPKSGWICVCRWGFEVLTLELLLMSSHRDGEHPVLPGPRQAKRHEGCMLIGAVWLNMRLSTAVEQLRV
jgi:hypothetical protein